uniref:nucleotide exchange factor GrpE n=1 Tax=Prevotella sp. TaxID=59823 RepID=UPI003FF07C08
MSKDNKKEQEIDETLEKEDNTENETTAETEDTQTDNVAEEKDELTKAKEEIAQLKDKYLRAIAEFDNYKKRTLKEKAELLLNGSEKTVTSILPILDDFERALADNNEDPKAMKEGITLIYNKFIKTLESLGVKKIDTDGKDFDVDYHEAVAMVPGMGDDNKGKVIDCVQTGYQLNDKVIRHAKVAVGQ